MDPLAQILVWLPHSYTGRGPAESCVRIVETFLDAGLQSTLFVNRARAPVPNSIHVVESVGGMLRRAPYRFIANTATHRLSRKFKVSVENAPRGSVAYFWPNAPISLVRHAKRHGMICVREMINSPLSHAKPILDAAYSAAGLPCTHGITETMVATENEEIMEYDFVFSSNAQVDKALQNLGLSENQILRSTFGWVEKRFERPDEKEPNNDQRPLRAVFVGLMNVRKGIPTLLQAWEMANIEGELLLAGTVEDCLAPLIARHCQSDSIRMLGHVQDVAGLYRSCDMFVFPTHEEGGPQVTYEAAASGIPIITTKMGAARLVEDGKTGLIVADGDAQGLAKALVRMSEDRSLRDELSKNAISCVGRHEYKVVGKDRAEMLLDCIERA